MGTARKLIIGHFVLMPFDDSIYSLGRSHNRQASVVKISRQSYFAGFICFLLVCFGAPPARLHLLWLQCVRCGGGLVCYDMFFVPILPVFTALCLVT